MLGTDYPFPLGEDVAGKLIEHTDVIDDKTKVSPAVDAKTNDRWCLR